MGTDSLRLDARSAFRGLRQRRTATLAAVSMLGLAIGLTAAMFTVVDALILHPLPFTQPDQLAVIRMVGKEGGRWSTAPAVLTAWRESRAFAFVEAAQTRQGVIAAPAGDLVRGMVDITPGIFTMLGGVRPIQGRLFDATDGQPGADDRVLISEDLWRTGYSADPFIVGHAITIGDRQLTVVGVLPAEFRFPESNTEVWRAATFSAPSATSSLWPMVYVRFASTVPKADALKVATTTALAAGARQNTWATSAPLDAATPEDYYAKAMPLLSGGVVLLFVGLCANVASMQLAGLNSRRRDVATQVALGAPRWRLVRQAFVESAVIGIAGVAIGIFLAWELVAIAKTTLPSLRSLNPLNFDWRTLVVTSAAGAAAILVTGILPAIIGTRIGIGATTQLNGRTSTESPRGRIATRLLLVSQIAFSCMLLIGATALVRSFVNLMTADRGIDSKNVVVAWVAMTGKPFQSQEARDAAARALEDQGRALPGVTHVAWSYGTPPQGAIGLGKTWTPDGGPGVTMEVTQSIVGGQFFGLYGISILRGRSFEPTDDPQAVVISERLGKALWPNAEAVGRSVTLDNEEASPRRQIVFRVIGVAKDTHFPSLKKGVDVPQLYTQYRNTSYTPMLSLRCSGPCPESGIVRRRLSEAAPGVRVQSVDVLDDVYASQFKRPRAAAFVAVTFAVTALLATASGLFSLLSYTVARRRKEFGIRSALGATPAAVRQLVWRDGLPVTAIGIGIGTVAGISISRLLAALLYDVTVADPLSWGIVSIVLAIAITAASWSPARSAAQSNPLTLLREE